MKTAVFTFFLSSVNLFSFSQINLVQNPSFEDISSCPTALDQLSKSIGWTSILATPDYFNSCANITSSVSVPNNSFGQQFAFSGNAYAGFWARNLNNYREYLGTQLLTNLQIGIRYYISFKVNLSSDPIFSEYCGVNNLGIHLSTINSATFSANTFNNYSQVYSDVIITDTLNWLSIKGSFISDSLYSFLMIGNFFPDSLTDSIQMLGFQCQAYYFLDDVCLSTDSAYAYNYTYLSLNEKTDLKNIIIYPNPASKSIVIQTQSFFNNSYDIIFYNSLGEEIYSQFNISDPIEHIPIESFNDKILFIKVKCNNKSFFYKLIKL